MSKIPPAAEPFHIHPALALERCLETLQRYGRDEIQVWPRNESYSENEGLRLFMPAQIGEWEGYKLIREQPSSTQGRLGPRRSLMVVRHPRSGRAWAFPADGLTDVRTGAAAVLAAEFTCPVGVRKAAVIGAGRVAGSILRCLNSWIRRDASNRLGALQSVSVYSRSAESRHGFLSRMQPDVTVPLCEAESAQEAVSGAGVVFLAASSSLPVVESDDLDRPVSVVAVSGSPLSGALGGSILQAAETIVVDQMEQCLRSGELAALVRAGQLDRLHFASWGQRQAHLGDAALGRVGLPDGSIVVAYLSGLAILDLAVGITLVDTGAIPVLQRSNPLAREPGFSEEDPWQPIP